MNHQTIYANWVSNYLSNNPRAAEFRSRCREGGLASLDTFLDQLKCYEPFVSDFSKFRWNHSDKSFLDVSVTGQIEWWQQNPKLLEILNQLQTSAAPPASHTIIEMDQITNGVDNLSLQFPLAGQAKQSSRNFKLAQNAVCGLLYNCAQEMMYQYTQNKGLELDPTCDAFDKLLKIFKDGSDARDKEKASAALAKLTELLFKLEPYADTERKQQYIKEAKRAIEDFSALP